MAHKHKSELHGKIESGMKVLAAAGLLGMALVTGADVVGRGVWNTPLFGAEEIVSILAVLVIGFSLPYTHSQGSHIGVEIIVRRLSQRTRWTIILLTHLASAILFAIVSWRMLLYGLSQRKAGVVSMNLALPTYWVIWVLGFCFLVFSIFLFRSAWRSIPKIRR